MGITLIPKSSTAPSTHTSGRGADADSGTGSHSLERIIDFGIANVE